MSLMDKHNQQSREALYLQGRAFSRHADKAGDVFAVLHDATG